MWVKSLDIGSANYLCVVLSLIFSHHASKTVHNKHLEQSNPHSIQTNLPLALLDLEQREVLRQVNTFLIICTDRCSRLIIISLYGSVITIMFQFISRWWACLFFILKSGFLALLWLLFLIFFTFHLFFLPFFICLAFSCSVFLTWGTNSADR